MNKIAILIPVYDKGKDFKLLSRFLKSMNKNTYKVDVWIVFSDEQQENKFNSNYGRFKYNGIVLASELRSFNNQITIKKFYGMKRIKNDYEKIVILDCETVFIKESNLDEIIDDIISRKCLYANSSPYSFLVKKTAEILNLEDNDILLEKTKNFQLYWWFNEIPVYLTKDLDLFFDWFESKNIEIIYNDKDYFDYIIYSLWLIVYKKWEVININMKADAGILESIYSFGIKKTNIFEQIEIRDSIHELLDTHWTTIPIFSKKKRKVIMSFHVDRIKYKYIIYNLMLYYVYVILNIKRGNE